MQICPSCCNKNKVEAGDVYCFSCGNPLPIREPQVETAPEEDKQATSKPIVMTIIICGLAVLAIGGLIGWSIGRPSYTSIVEQNDNLIARQQYIEAKYQTSVQGLNSLQIEYNALSAKYTELDNSYTSMTKAYERARTSSRYPESFPEPEPVSVPEPEVVTITQVEYKDARKFSSYHELESWVRSIAASEEETPSGLLTKSQLYTRALELQELAYKDGFIISVGLGPSPNTPTVGSITVYCEAQINDKLYWWKPYKDEIKATWCPLEK
ncbi:hypothetical protein ACFLWI_05935 [Chloroflexota bacterium]